MRVRSRRTSLVAAVVALATLAAGCGAEEPRAGPSASPDPTRRGATSLTFAVYGPPPVLEAYANVAADFTEANPATEVTVQPYASRAEATAALVDARAKGVAPDVFLTDHEDMPQLLEDEAVRPLNDLLAAREVDFGDGFARKGLEAFSSAAALQCMPVDISPLVVYYNPRLVDLSTLAAPEDNPVDAENGWSLEEFARAARQARAPGVRGLYVQPDLLQVAPFIWSGGGELVDDTQEPTTLTLSSEGSRESLQELLEVVRDPALTFSRKALQRTSALARFKSGNLAMMLGFRSLTPVLRAQADLSFDVMPLPRLSAKATSGDMTGVCLSADTPHEDAAADFIAYVVSQQAAETLAATGYVMPSNLDVLNSETFAQPALQPASAQVFLDAVRYTRALPLSPHWPAVRSQTVADLTELFFQPVILPLEERLAEIDRASVPLFDPEASPAGLPSPSPTDS